ncbi:MAG: cyclic nucleotide-binding domain-containing protein [Nitrospirales bacterium]
MKGRGDMVEQGVALNKLWYLKHINLFSALTMPELQEIDRITRMQEVKKRQPIYLPGDPSTTVYLLKKGRVKIANSNASGKELRRDGGSAPSCAARRSLLHSAD